MSFDYTKQTREHYKDPAVARAYHEEYTELSGLKGLRFRLVADGERKAVAHFLQQCGARTVLDLPTGTGKMASVFARLKIDVTAADISNDMLDIARATYNGLDYQRVRFVECDAESATKLIPEQGFDAVVCIRLMHRVPATIRAEILKKLAKTAPKVIVSFGIDSWLQRVRRVARRLVLGGKDVSASEYASLTSVMSELGAHFKVVSHRAAVPLLSGERIFYLSSNG